MTPPPSPSSILPASLAPHNPSQGPLPSVQCNHQSHGPLGPPPFLRSWSWKLRVQPDDNLPIFSRKKWWRGSVQLNVCYGCNVRNLTGSLLTGTLALTVSERRRLPASHRALHPLKPPSKNPMAAPWGAEASHAQHSPRPHSPP